MQVQSPRLGPQHHKNGAWQCMLAILALQRRKHEGQKCKVVFSSTASLGSMLLRPHGISVWIIWGNIITVCMMYIRDLSFVGDRDEPN